MADRFPLIINSEQGQIQELASGDNLDLSGSNLYNVNNISSVGDSTFENVEFVKFNETVVDNGDTGAATISPDVASGTIFKYTLTDNIVLNSLTNAVAGSGCTLILTQDGIGSRTLTSTMLFLGGTKTLSTAAGSVDIVSVFYDGTTYYATLGKGYA